MTSTPQTPGFGTDVLRGHSRSTSAPRTTDDGDHERLSHYVPKDKLMDAMVNGTPVVALCGKVWVPSRDPQRFPVCPECKEIWDSMREGDDAGMSRFRAVAAAAALIMLSALLWATPAAGASAATVARGARCRASSRPTARRHPKWRELEGPPVTQADLEALPAQRDDEAGRGPRGGRHPAEHRARSGPWST